MTYYLVKCSQTGTEQNLVCRNRRQTTYMGKYQLVIADDLYNCYIPYDLSNPKIIENIRKLGFTSRELADYELNALNYNIEHLLSDKWCDVQTSVVEVNL